MGEWVSLTLDKMLPSQPNSSLQGLESKEVDEGNLPAGRQRAEGRG